MDGGDGMNNKTCKTLVLIAHGLLKTVSSKSSASFIMTGQLLLCWLLALEKIFFSGALDFSI